MRRILAITLMLIFGLPMISPLFALGGDAQANLPACCRRDGIHHCMMGMNMDSTSTGASASSGAGSRTTAAIVTERCPYGAQAMPVAVHEGWTLDTSAAVFAGLVSHPAGSPQTESKRRVASLRARQKRGPPVLSL
ncbi:MAG TPA: hypothetical protein VNW54_13260 [Granulicella sp.]|nr:hypothetical protein [Granulicella sp.]